MDPLDQGWATIFVRGPHWDFVCVSRAKFISNMLFLKLKSKNGAFAGRMLPFLPYILFTTPEGSMVPRLRTCGVEVDKLPSLNLKLKRKNIL